MTSVMPSKPLDTKGQSKSSSRSSDANIADSGVIFGDLLGALVGPASQAMTTANCSTQKEDSAKARALSNKLVPKVSTGFTTTSPQAHRKDRADKGSVLVCTNGGQIQLPQAALHDGSLEALTKRDSSSLLQKGVSTTGVTLNHGNRQHTAMTDLASETTKESKLENRAVALNSASTASVPDAGPSTPVGFKNLHSTSRVNHAPSSTETMPTAAANQLEKSKVKKPDLPGVQLSALGTVHAPPVHLMTLTTPASGTTSSQTPRLHIKQVDALSQFGQLLSVKVNEGQNQLQVQIVPQGMGQLDVTITKGPDGIQIELLANQATTYQVLNQQLPALQQAVQAAGVNLAGMQLSYGQSGGQSGDGQERQENQSVNRPTRIVSQSGSVLNVDGHLPSPSIASHVGAISLSV